MLKKTHSKWINLLYVTWRKYYESFHFKPNLWCQIRCIFEFCFLLPWSSVFLEGDECFLTIFPFSQELCLTIISVIYYQRSQHHSFYLIHLYNTMLAACNKASFTSLWRQNLGFDSKGNLNLWGLFGFSREVRISSWLIHFLCFILVLTVKIWQRNELVFVIILAVAVGNYHLY